MIVFYSTHCPKCGVLEKKLKQKNIQFLEVNDVEIMKEKGLSSAPALEVDGVMMNFKTATEWLKNQ